MRSLPLLLEVLRLEGAREAVPLVEPVAEVHELAARGAEGPVREVVREVVDLPVADGTMDGHPGE